MYKKALNCILSIFSQPTAITQPSSPVPRSDTSGVLGKLSDLSVYDQPSTSDVTLSEDTVPICRQGKSGTK